MRSRQYESGVQNATTESSLAGRTITIPESLGRQLLVVVEMGNDDCGAQNLKEEAFC